VWLIGYVISFGILGHNDPPPSDGYTANQLMAHYFAPYHGQIMVGMLICMVVGVFYLPASCAAASVMLRREHRSPILATLVVCAGAITAWIVAEFPGKILHAASYGRSNPFVVQGIWREAWYIYDNTYMCSGMGMIAMAIYALIDRSAKPVWPKWVAWVAIAAVVSFIPEAALPYVHTGPFALQGLWNFWLAFVLWLVWFAGFSFYTIRYLREKLREPDVTLQSTRRASEAAELEPVVFD
jgi:hypothetical protein